MCSEVSFRIPVLCFVARMAYRNVRRRGRPEHVEDHCELLLVFGGPVGFGGVAEGVAAAAGKQGPPRRSGDLEGVEHVEQLGDDAANRPHVDLLK